MILLGKEWERPLAGFLSSPRMGSLMGRVDQAYKTQTVYPPRCQLFRALELTPYSQVKAVILGQDPYHRPGRADGLAFSVPIGVDPPPSLRSIFQELEADLPIKMPAHGCLEQWAENGVLLLNTILTVEAGKAKSHQGLGWEFTDTILEALNRREEPVAFLLWGGSARRKKGLVTNRRHLVLEAAHPSPRSAYRGFFGCRHFSQAARFLESQGSVLSWALPGCKEEI